MPFIPLEEPTARKGFVPLADLAPDRPTIAGQMALNNPVTAIGETALNVATQSVAMPVAGLAGLVTEAARAAGLTERQGADIVHAVGEALTYQPRGEMGKATTEAVMWPFEKLAEAGQAVGGATLDATGSPAAATAVDTAVNALPLALGVRKSPKIGGLEAAKHNEASLQILAKAHPDEATRALAELELDARRRHAPPPPAEAPRVENVERPPVAETPPPEAAPMPPRVEEVPPPVVNEPAPRVVPAAISEQLQRWLDETDPVSLEEAQGVVSQSRAAGYDGHVVVPSRDGFTAVPGEWLSPDQRASVERLQPPRQGEPVAMPLEDMPRQVERELPPQVESVAPPLAEPDRPMQAMEMAPRPRDGELPRQAEPVAPHLEESQRPVEAAPDAPVQTEAQPVSPQRGFTPLAQHEQAMAPGAQHIGLIDDAKLTDTAPRRAEPLRREDILADLVKALDTTIYEGRIKRKGVLGLYTPNKETVRIKRAADIEVAAHELAHLLDDRIPEIKALYKADKAIAKELRGVSYDKTKLHEGFAEYVRLYMTQPAEAAARAPGFTKWFEDFIGQHEYGPAIKKAQEDMGAWFNQDALDRARSKIGANKKFNEAFDGIWDRFRQSTVDDLHGIYRMERDLKGEVKPGGAYETARLSRASASIAEGTINFGYPVRKKSGAIDYAGKGLREILEPVAGKLEDTLLYFVGRSAEELKMQGRENLFTGAEIKAMLDLRTPERAAAFAEYQKWNAGVVEFAESMGAINPASRRLWQRQAYMPFHRVGQPGSYSAKPGDWSGIKALTGGTENLRDVLGNMIGNAAMLVDKALKNEARLKVAELAEKERGAGKFMTRIDPESRPVRIDKEQVLRAVLKSLGLDKSDPAAAKFIRELEVQIASDPGMFELMMHNQAPAGNNVVAVMKSGRPVYFEVADPVLYRALTAIDRPTQSWLVKMLGLPKRVGQTATTLTPDFMVANIARDTLMGAVMSRAGFRPIMDSLAGMRHRIKSDEVYRQYIANGGGLSSIYLDEGKLRARLDKFYQGQGIDYRTVLDAPDKLLGFVETLADAFETSTRLGEFQRAREAGQHPRHAAYLAREVSTDFAMRGDNPAINFMYDTVMFLKPAVLSFDRLGRGLAHDPNRAAIAAKAGMVALFSMGLYLLNSEEERYQDLADWDRDTHWHFFVGDQHFRYPKIWEIGALASVAERSLQATIEGDPSGLGGDLGRIIGQTFSLNWMPQILAPIYEQATNRNSFTKALIETPGMEEQQPFMRAKANTSQTMQALGMATRNMPEALQVNPVRTEALLRGYLSTWALYGLQLSDKAFFADEMPAGRTDQLPVVRRFYSEEPPLHTKYEQQYYDMLGESRRLFGTMRSLYKDGRQDLAEEYRDDPRLETYGGLEGTSKVLQMINMKMRAIRRDDSLDPEQKREALDEWTVKRNEVLKMTVGKVKEVRGGE